MVFCSACIADFPDHFTVEARHKRRWRGKSFDADEARGNLGVALAGILGVSASTTEGFNRFSRAFTIQVFRETEARDLNPARLIPEGEGETWWFHVGVREEFPDDVLARMRESVREAVLAAPGYVDARVSTP